MSKNFNEVLKQRELDENAKSEKDMSLDSTERVKVLSPGQLVFKRFVNNKLAIVGTFILLAMFTFAFIVPIFYPYSQTQIFYKYSDTVVEYAQVTERKDYSIMMEADADELHYSLKNYLTADINDIKSKNLSEKYLSDEQGNTYRLCKDDDYVFSLYKENCETIATSCSSIEYGVYKVLGKELEINEGVAKVKGFDNALADAIASRAKEFSVDGKNFSLVQNKKEYNIYLEADGIVYEDFYPGEGFEKAFIDNLTSDSFEFGNKTYRVKTEGENIVAFLIDNEEKVAVLTTYVFDAYDGKDNLGNNFENAAVSAFANGLTFECDGITYVIQKENDEFVVYDKANSSEPVGALSTQVIRRSNGEDTLEFAFKEKTREVIEQMAADSKKTAKFTWPIAQVDANGEYTYDDNGEIVKEDREITITEKNGIYDLSVAQVVYLINTFERPSKVHLAGTDGDGMDVLARMMYGGRVSLIFSFVVIIIETVLGVIMGGIAGYFGGWVDNLIMRLVDIFYCIPHLPILIILGAMFDAMKVKPYVRVAYLMIILGVLGWAGVARMVRGQILSLREQEFMVATEALGIRTKKRIFKHLIPNVMPLLIVTATSGLGDIIITESTLSFLGLGVKHPLATWGTMIDSVSSAEAMKAYTYIWVPVGLLICLTVVAFNFVGDGLRDAFDPKMKR